jgi:hypothetical protein
MPGWGTIAALAGGTILLALTLLPDLKAMLLDKPPPFTAVDLDQGNLVTWFWLEQRGAFPMRDYWYPYGGQWTFAVYPLGPVWDWFYQVVVLGLFAWALYRLNGGRTVRTILCVAAFVVVSVWAPSVWRYGPALAPALCLAAIGPASHTRLTWGHAVFGLACLAAAFLGPDILVVEALSGIVLVVIGEWLRAARPWRQWVRGLAIDAIPFVATVVLLVAYWLVTHSFDGNIRLWLGLDKVSAGYAIDQVQMGPLTGVTVAPTIAAILIALTFLVVSAGLVQTVWNRGRDFGAAPILLAGGGVAFATLLKYVVRPYGYELLYVPLIALVWAAIVLLGRRAWLTIAAAAVFVGALVALAQIDNNALRNYWFSLSEVPSRVVGAASLVGDRPEIRKRADDQFAPERFKARPEAPIANALKVMTGGNVPTFATLGDWSVLYLLLNQDPPYQIDYYDAAQIAEQENMLSVLKKEDPQLLVWNPVFGVDNVPYWVRNPMIFTWAVENYTYLADLPQSSFALRKRRPGEPINYDWWRSHFPNPLDLGAIPAMSTGADQTSCRSGTGCVPYAIVHGKPARSGQVVAFHVDGMGGRYPVVMRSVKGRDTMAVRLDRLWFWPIVGRHARISSDTTGYSLEVEDKRAGDALY